MIETAGLLKSTKFITRKERDEDELIEINMAVITLEVPLDNLTGDQLRFLALRQNQAVSIALGLTYQPIRPEKPDQATLTEEFQKAYQPEIAADSSEFYRPEDVIIEHVMERDGVTREEAVQHIESLADTLQEPEPEEEAEYTSPELAVLDKLVKHRGGSVVYRVHAIYADKRKVVLVNAATHEVLGEPVTFKTLEKFYVEAQEPVLTQV